MKNEDSQNVTAENFIQTLEGEEGSSNDNRVQNESIAEIGSVQKNISEGSTQDSSANSEKGELTATSSRSPSPFVKVEKSLASLGFFTPSSRRIKNQKVKRIGFTRDIQGKRVEVTAEIVPSAIFGLPMTADQDKYLALQKIITNTLQSEGKIANPIRFKSADLLRLLNTNTKTGKNYKEISEWLDVMSSTTIISNGAIFSSGQKRFVRDRFRVFDRAVSVGKELEDGTVADANYVWLSAWQLDNMNQNYLLPIDLEVYRELKNYIAKALIPLLQIWLYASHKAGAFEKRYDELCEILTLQAYRSPSQILRQLKPSLDELVHHEYLEKWRIEKTSDRKAFKIVFIHGQKFHRDRRRRLEQKTQTEPVIVAESEPNEPKLPEHGRLQPNLSKTSMPANVAPESTTPIDLKGQLVDDLAGRGLTPSTVMRLLETLPENRLKTIPETIEYWDSVRATKSVEPGLLYTWIRDGDPIPSTFETKAKRAKRLEEEAQAKQKIRMEETLKARYEEYCRRAGERAIAEVPKEKLERLVAEYRDRMLSEQGGFWSEKPVMAEQFARHAVEAGIRTAGLQTYEEFRSRELALDDAQSVPDRRESSGDNIAPKALEAAPSNVHVEEEGFVISDENDTP